MSVEQFQAFFRLQNGDMSHATSKGVRGLGLLLRVTGININIQGGQKLIASVESTTVQNLSNIF